MMAATRTFKGEENGCDEENGDIDKNGNADNSLISDGIEQ